MFKKVLITIAVNRLSDRAAVNKHPTVAITRKHRGSLHVMPTRRFASARPHPNQLPAYP